MCLSAWRGECHSCPGTERHSGPPGVIAKDKGVLGPACFAHEKGLKLLTTTDITSAPLRKKNSGRAGFITAEAEDGFFVCVTEKRIKMVITL